MTKQDHKPWILAVEDDTYIGLLIQYLLRTQFNLVLTSSFAKARRAASRQRFDLFLFDINLQEDRTGIDLLKELRQQPEHSQTPAVACTAYVHEGSSERFLAEGFDSYVEKPFTTEILLSTVHHTLADARQQAVPDRQSRPRTPLSGKAFRGIAA